MIGIFTVLITLFFQDASAIDCHWFLAGDRALEERYDTILSGQAGSLFEVDPKLRKGASAMQSGVRLFQTHGESITFRQLIERILVLRNHFAEQLEVLAAGTSDPRAIDALKKTAIRIRPSFPVQRSLARLVEEVGSQNIRDESSRYNLNAVIQNYWGPVRGAFAELNLYCRASDPLLFDSPISEVQEIANWNSRAESKLPFKLRQLKVDFIFENGTSWGEVKNYTAQLDSGQQIWKKNVWPQAVDHVKKRDEVNRRIGPSGIRLSSQVKLHYFIVGGITDEAARQLEMLGIIVHGNRDLSDTRTPDPYLAKQRP